MDWPQSSGQDGGYRYPVYLSLHLVLRAPFLFALFKADRNAFILTGSQIYILIIALVIAANGVRFRRNAEFKESVLAAISKTMTGVYIVHYSVFHLLTALIPVTSLGMKLALIVLTFITSVLFSMLILSNSVAKR